MQPRIVLIAAEYLQSYEGNCSELPSRAQKSQNVILKAPTQQNHVPNLAFNLQAANCWGGLHIRVLVRCGNEGGLHIIALTHYSLLSLGMQEPQCCGPVAMGHAVGLTLDLSVILC